MKKQFNKNQLATLKLEYIKKEYGTPESLYEKLKTNVNGKVKAINKRDLTDNELEEQGIKLAKTFSGWINDLNTVERTLSNEIIDKAIVGIEEDELIQYFSKSAKETVRNYINFRFKQLRKQMKF